MKQRERKRPTHTISKNTQHTTHNTKPLWLRKCFVKTSLLKISAPWLRKINIYMYMYMYMYSVSLSVYLYNAMYMYVSQFTHPPMNYICVSANSPSLPPSILALSFLSLLLSLLPSSLSAPSRASPPPPPQGATIPVRVPPGVHLSLQAV